MLIVGGPLDGLEIETPAGVALICIVLENGSVVRLECSEIRGSAENPIDVLEPAMNRVEFDDELREALNDGRDASR